MDLTEISEGRIIEGQSPKRLYLEHMSRYAFAIPYARNGNVLDIGSGTGYGADFMTHTAQRVIGLEFDRKSIQYGRTRYDNENLNFVQGDANHLPFKSNTFDTITAFLVLEHIHEHDLFCQEISRSLAENGYFIGATPNKDVFNIISRGNPAHGYIAGKTPELHFKEFKGHELKTLLYRHFCHVKLYGQNHLKFGKVIYTFIRTKMFNYGKVVLSALPCGVTIRGQFRKKVLGHNRNEANDLTGIEEISKKQITEFSDSIFLRPKHLFFMAKK